MKKSTVAIMLTVTTCFLDGTGCNNVKTSANEQSVNLSGDVTIRVVRTPRGLWLGETEVTQAQWQSVMGYNPSKFKGDNLPVESVSWDDCKSFLERLNALPSVKESGLSFRLPTDEEWEYASRAGSTDRFCKTGDGTEITNESLSLVAWMKNDSEGKTHPAGTKKPNAFGLYDMIGNVDEWVADTYGSVDPDAKDKDYADDRITRGGNYRDKPGFCSSGVRGRSAADNKSETIGLRLCASGRAD